MSKIKVEEILNTHVGVLSIRSEVLHKAYKAAIKEIVEKAIDMAAEEGKNNWKRKFYVSESILNVKTMFDYE